MIHSGKIWTYHPDVPMEETSSPSFDWRLREKGGTLERGIGSGQNNTLLHIISSLESLQIK
jgi:hypothetical protein